MCLRRHIPALIVARLLGEPYAIVGSRFKEYLVSQFRLFINVNHDYCILYLDNVGRKIGLYDCNTRAVYVKVLSIVWKVRSTHTGCSETRRCGVRSLRLPEYLEVAFVEGRHPGAITLQAPHNFAGKSDCRWRHPCQLGNFESVAFFIHTWPKAV